MSLNKELDHNSAKGGGSRVAAFTLIELLIVVAIIAIIGITSISGLSRMAEVQDSETTMKVLSNRLDTLDQDIFEHRTVSYDTVFESGSLGFLTNIDWYWKTPSLQCSFDFATGSGTIKSVGTGTGTIGLHFASGDTSWRNARLSMSGEIQTFSFPRNIPKRQEKISSGFGERALNSYVIQYYNLTNVYNTPEKEVRLIKIEGTPGAFYSSLLIRNVRGKKSLQGSGATQLDSLEKATLTFEKNGKEMQMVVSR